MVVDYSKWDKLELSDDSDIEVHPNVDKASFIRWKQRDIHEKRQRNKFRTAQLDCNIETNRDLLKCVDALLKAAKSGTKIGFDIPASTKLALTALDGKAKPSLSTAPEQPKYGDMIESMLLQVVNEVQGEDKIVAKIEEHRAMMTSALEDELKELEQLHEERSKHILSDDLKTGWDSTLLNANSEDKSKTDAASSTESAGPKATKKMSTTTTEIETINSPSSSSATADTEPAKSAEGVEELLPATKAFGEIAKGDLSAAYRFMAQHPSIITDGQKDALIMTAFDAELEGRHKDAERIVYNSLLLQYSAMIGGGEPGARQFLGRLGGDNAVAKRAFEEDANNTYKHIQGRCKILSEEGAEGGNAEIVQLRSVDPDTELSISVPDPDSEGYAIYNQFSPEIKDAIEKRQLDDLNAVLASMDLKDAEQLVGQLGESGVLKIDQKVYEPEEWEAKQNELAGKTSSE